VEEASGAPRVSPGRVAAFGVEHGGEERLVVVQEVRAVDAAGLDVARAAGDVREAVTERHGVRVDAVVFVKAGAIPRTSSGKVRRAACRASYLANALASIAEVA
jgi:acyl-CoA synthetase (AMP-forming)/AMP-acid ligase II